MMRKGRINMFARLIFGTSFLVISLQYANMQVALAQEGADQMVPRGQKGHWNEINQL